MLASFGLMTAQEGCTGKELYHELYFSGPTDPNLSRLRFVARCNWIAEREYIPIQQASEGVLRGAERNRFRAAGLGDHHQLGENRERRHYNRYLHHHGSRGVASGC